MSLLVRIQSVKYEPVKTNSISPALSEKYGGDEEVQRILDLIAYYEQGLDIESGDTAIHVAAREGKFTGYIRFLIFLRREMRRSLFN